jgi:hypothetical protein
VTRRVDGGSDGCQSRACDYDREARTGISCRVRVSKCGDTRKRHGSRCAARCHVLPADSLPPSGRSLIHRSTCGAPSRSFGSLTKTSRGSSPDGAGDVTRHRTAVSTGAVGARDRANGVSEGLVRGATERANRRERVRESVGEERGVSSRPATALVRSPIHPATSPRTTPSTRRKQFRSSRAVRSPRAAARTARRS